MLGRIQRVGQLIADLLFQLVVIGLVNFSGRHLAFGLARTFTQIGERGTDLFDLDVGKLNRVDHLFFRNLFGPGLNHQDALRRAHNSNVEEALAHLRIGGVNDELIVDQSDAYRSHRAGERNIRQGQCAGCRVNAQDVGIVFSVGGRNQGDDVGLVAEAFREQGANRTINLAAGKNFSFAGTAFTLDEPAGDASAGIGVFTVVNGERKEINSFAGIGAGTCGA